MKRRYYSYSQYLGKTFGTRVHRLSLDAGFSCPNLDGTLSNKGCLFCNNKAFSPYAESKKTLGEQIETSMAFARRRYKAEKFIAYFQSFTNTYASPDLLSKKYSIVRDFKDIVAISVSTRPDCIDSKKLELLEEFSKKYKVYIEYGLQSIHNKTLKKINRNHDFESFKKAIRITQNFKNIHSSAHIILGLPGETKKNMLDTAKALAKMPLWGLKIHCLHVVKSTSLFAQYKAGKIKLLSKEKYLDLLIDFLACSSKKAVILRTISDANPKELIGPKWLNEKSKALEELDAKMEAKNICQGDLADT